MKFNALITMASVLMASTTFAQAEAYCPEMLAEDTLERRYQRLAPIYNDVETGWIFGSDQFENRYALNAVEETLLQQLVAELATHGTDLAILIAPPRPTVAGQEIVDATIGIAGLHDTAQQGAAFHQMIEQMSATGAHVPNLLALIESDTEIRDVFYFQRDTHWTNLGAAHSALALAQAVDARLSHAFSVGDLPVAEMTSERGSLSDIMEATCGDRPDGENSPLLDYSAHLAGTGDLLGGSATVPSGAVLLGTSFSDRYRRDQYQLGEALSAALGRTVDNRSVSGGGMIGPFETYVLSGQFSKDRPDLIIWEFPYTYELNERALRQLLGAVRSIQQSPTTTHIDLNGNEEIHLVVDRQGAPDLVGVRIAEGAVRDVVLRFMSEDGDESAIHLRRKSRMEEITVLSDWWVDLSDIGFEIDAIAIEFRGDDLPAHVEVLGSVVSG